MSDQLISREALKKELEKVFFNDNDDMNRIEQIIDNAPTVDTEKLLVANVTFDEDKLKEIVQTEVIDKIKSGELVLKDENPQGDIFPMEIVAGKCPIEVSGNCPLRSQGEWIPIKYRPLTVDERIAFAEHYGIEYSDTIDEKAFDCPMPKDDQDILISTSWGVVEDVADNDVDGEGFICYGLEKNGDWDGVDAWMPMPKAYEKGGAE